MRHRAPFLNVSSALSGIQWKVENEVPKLSLSLSLCSVCLFAIYEIKREAKNVYTYPMLKNTYHGISTLARKSIKSTIITFNQKYPNRTTSVSIINIIISITSVSIINIIIPIIKLTSHA